METLSLIQIFSTVLCLILPCQATFTVLETKFKLYYSEYDQKVGLSNSYRSFALFNVDIGIQHNFKKAEVMNYITGFLDKNNNDTVQKPTPERCTIYYSYNVEIADENGNKTEVVVNKITQSQNKNINNNFKNVVKPFLFINYTDILEHHCDIDDIIFANNWNKPNSNDKMEEISNDIFIYENNESSLSHHKNNTKNIVDSIKINNNSTLDKRDNTAVQNESQVTIEPSMIIISLPEKDFEKMKAETDPNIIGLKYTKKIMHSRIPITFVKDDELLFLTTNITTNQLWMQMIPAPTEATIFQYQNSTKVGYVIECVINILLFFYALFINCSNVKKHLKTKKTLLNKSKDNNKKYSGHIILTNMGYLFCYICGSLLLYKFIDAYTKNYFLVKTLTIWSSFIILPCSMISKVIFDLLNLWWCPIVKSIAFYIVIAILFLQCISISIFGKKIYNVLSKSQSILLNSPYHPRSNDDHKNNNGSYRPKNQSGTSFWIILLTRIILTDGCVYLIVLLFKKENNTNCQGTPVCSSPYTPYSPSLNTSFIFNTSRILGNEVPIVSPSSSSTFNLNDYFKLKEIPSPNNNHINIRNCHSNIKKVINQDSHKSKITPPPPNLHNNKTNREAIININKIKNSRNNKTTSKINENYDAIFKEIEESIIILSEDTEDASTIDINLPRKESLQRNNTALSSKRRKSVIDIFNDTESSLLNIFKRESEINY
ncbi:hypothetical protein PIROE2DRAFT_9365 [Piromyces sp. E2]|nr:hypothetical protein PIROE2DRAFT_9365 [Piromyces sp. E2]|eukprot:OUM63981.1 hypothetical protein PIROE2DRAFT_9365 [Piromyces sp. E2]